MRLTQEHSDAWQHTIQPPDALLARIKAARTVVERMSGTGRWVMHIPPEVDDGDIVLSDVLDQCEMLVKREGGRR